MNDDEIEVVAQHLLKKSDRPNNYTLTKAVAEDLILKERGQLPVCIIRPSIVGASQEEPMKVGGSPYHDQMKYTSIKLCR